MRRAAFALGLAISIFAGSHAVAGEYVVTASSGNTGQGLGALLTPSDIVSLSDGSRLELFSISGQKVRLSGPLEGSLAELLSSLPKADQKTAPSAIDQLAALIDPKKKTSSLGAFRASNTEPDKANLVNLEQSGTYCVMQGEVPQIWRRVAQIPQTATIGSVSVNFRRGQVQAPWPSALPLTNGTQYNVSLSGLETPATITLAAVPNQLTDPGQQAFWMMGNGCADQAKRLILSLPVNEVVSGKKSKSIF